MNTAKLANLIEKGHYPFKSYPRSRCETVLFAGCSFPSQFPRTMDALADACRAAGWGIVYDCCGEPLAGFGAAESGERVLRQLDRRLARLGCKRVVLACPNCLAHLSGRIACETVGVLDVLDELGFDSAGEAEAGRLFIPCPDKAKRAGVRALERHGGFSEVPVLERVGCCGLRADIAARGPEVSARACAKVLEAAGDERIYSYCASCLGQFVRAGHGDCRHVLSVLLDVDEQPDVGHALANRAKRKFDRNVEPTGGQVAE